MAQGRKYNNDIKEKAFALLATNNNPQAVADELNIPYTTIKTWEKKWLKEAENKPQNEDSDGNTKNNEQNLIELRNKKKEEFVENAWSLIDKVRTLLERRLDRAITSEDKIDELVEEITQLDHKDLTDNQRKALYTRIAAIKLDNVKELSVVLGTLYDKQALANKEATAIVEGLKTSNVSSSVDTSLTINSYKQAADLERQRIASAYELSVKIAEYKNRKYKDITSCIDTDIINPFNLSIESIDTLSKVLEETLEKQAVFNKGFNLAIKSSSRTPRK